MGLLYGLKGLLTYLLSHPDPPSRVWGTTLNPLKKPNVSALRSDLVLQCQFVTASRRPSVKDPGSRVYAGVSSQDNQGIFRIGMA